MKLHSPVVALIGATCALVLPACQQDSSGPAEPLGVRVQFLTDEGLSAEIPAALYGGFLNVCVAPPASDCASLDDPSVRTTFYEIGSPDLGTGLFDPGADMDGDGRPERDIQDLPYDVDLKLEIAAVLAIGDRPLFSARFDGIRLAKGERRFLTVTLSPVNQLAAVPGTALQAPEGFTGRFGSSVTGLPDGRVLIAGGFDFGVPLTIDTCRARVPAIADGSVCFHLVASPKAYVFVPGSGRLYELAEGLGEPTGRAFHSAVALPDGRVFLAGGIDAAVLSFTPLTGGGWFPTVTPITGTADVKGFHTTFEVFDPERNALVDNPNRDGNPERGGFTGLGTLAAPRLYSVAALWPEATPGAAPRVVLLGGADPATPPPARPSVTWEIWDSTLNTSTISSGSLARARAMAGVGLMNYDPTPELWIVGGALAATNDTDVIAVWENGAMGTSPLSPSPGNAHPGKNFLLPAVSPLGNAQAPVAHLVTGSFGPACNFDGTTYTPTYTPDGTGGPCPPAQLPPYVINRATPAVRLDAITGWTAADAPHVFGASAPLGDGSVVVVGGASDLEFAATQAAHRVLWVGGVAQKDGTLSPTSYPMAALFPAGTATAAGDAVFFGGVAVTLGGTPAIRFVDSIVLFNRE
jgi:hypothetical protein